MNYYPEFARLLNDFLVQTDRSPTWLARRVKVNPSTVTRWLNQGTRPGSPELVAQIADALGLAAKEKLLIAAGYRDEHDGGTAASTFISVSDSVRTVSDRSRTTGRQSNNLPAPPTPLIGRRTELEKVTRLLQQADVWLVTLSGTGGSGKTRLSLAIGAALLADFEDGVWFIDLSPIQDPELVLPTIAKTFGLAENTNQLLLQKLAQYLQERQMLLILDNFEQVASAALHLSELHTLAPSIHLLVTSRAPLHLRGEQELVVPPLALPKADDNFLAIQESEAVQLFTARMHTVQQDFVLTQENATTVAALCTKLDGIPLALELAAVRGRVLSIASILSYLANPLSLLTHGAHDLPDRQQALRNTISWSVALLTPDQQRLFRRLGVFQGGFTLESVEAICNVEEDLGQHLIDTLTALIEQQLVRFAPNYADDESRYAMLETIRAFAHEQLATSDEAEQIRQRHASHFCALAKQGNDEGNGPNQGKWLARLDRELDNFRAVLAWSLHTSDQAVWGMRLIDFLYYLWRSRGYVVEGHNWATAFRAQSFTQIPTEVYANFSQAAGLLASILGDGETAKPLLEQSVALWRTTDDKRGLAFSLMCLIDCNCVDDEKLMSVYEEGVALFRAVGDSWGVSILQSDMGTRAFRTRDYARAETLWEEALSLARSAGDKNGMAALLLNFGDLAFTQNEYERATAFYDECLTVIRDLNETWIYPAILLAQGKLAYAQRLPEQAEAFFQECLMLCRRINNSYRVAQALCGLGDLARWQRDYVQAELAYQESRNLFQEIDQKDDVAWLDQRLAHVALALNDSVRANSLLQTSLAFFAEEGDEQGILYCLSSMAGILAAKGEWAQATRLLGTVSVSLEAMRPAMAPADLDAYQLTFAQAQEQLAAPEFEKQWEIGAALPLSQVVSDLLASNELVQ